MRYAARQKNGKFINVDFEPSGLFAKIFVDCELQKHYKAEFDGETFFLSKELFTVAMIEMAGGKFASAKGVELVDENGTIYTLDWVNKKFGTVGVVYVPIKSQCLRFIPDSAIPEGWLPFKSVYIKHIAIKIRPFDYCMWRFQDSGHDLTDIQSICLDEVDYAIKRWIAPSERSYKTLRFVNDKMKSLASCRKITDPIDTLDLVEPLVLKPLEDILLNKEVYEALPRFYKAKVSCIKLVRALKETPIKVAKSLTQQEAPF